MLCALAGGLWILRTTWLDATLQNELRVPEALHEWHEPEKGEVTFGQGLLWLGAPREHRLNSNQGR